MKKILLKAINFYQKHISLWLESKNIKVYRTDILGTIIFTSDGDNINIKNVTTNTDGG